MEAVRKYFRPEFLNRLDEILLFRRLGRAQMAGIVEIQLNNLRKLLEPRRIQLLIDDKAKLWLGEKGYDPVYGARPLRRAIQTYLQNHLAEMILKGEIEDDATVQVGVKGDKLDFRVSSAPSDLAKPEDKQSKDNSTSFSKAG